MPPVKSVSQPLPSPTRARRSQPRAAPPYKWYLLGGAIFALLCVLGLTASLFLVFNFAKEEGYDPELSKRYPILAVELLSIKTMKLADEIEIDKERGILSYRIIKTGRRVRKQEVNGTIIFLPIEDETETVSPPPVIEPEPKRRIRTAPRKSQKDNF